MATSRVLDAIRVTAIELVRTVGPCGNETLWIPDVPRLRAGSPVRLHPEPAIPLEQALLSCVSMLGVGPIVWYAAIRMTGW
jgi:hypothetical protein